MSADPMTNGSGQYDPRLVELLEQVEAEGDRYSMPMAQVLAHQSGAQVANAHGIGLLRKDVKDYLGALVAIGALGFSVTVALLASIFVLLLVT